MKTISSIILCLVWSFPAFAKIASKVEIQDIQNVKIEENRITIIGNGVLSSRMVTTEEEKDSDFAIMGSPSAEYTAQGDLVEFTITPFTLELNDPNGDLSQAPTILSMKESFYEQWVQTIKAAKTLEEGGTVQLTIRGGDIRFDGGRLKSVTGQGVITIPKS